MKKLIAKFQKNQTVETVSLDDFLKGSPIKYEGEGGEVLAKFERKPSGPFTGVLRALVNGRETQYPMPEWAAKDFYISNYSLD